MRQGYTEHRAIRLLGVERWASDVGRFLLPLLACTLVAGATKGPAPEPLDLPGAINLALGQNLGLVRSRLNVDAAARVVSGEKAEFGFRLVPAGTASSSTGADAAEVGLGLFKRTGIGTRAGVTGALARDEVPGSDPLERSILRVTVTQPLLQRFGKQVNQDPLVTAELGLRSTRRLLEQQKADIVLEVAATYEDVLRLEGQVRAEEGFFERLDEVYRLTRARERQGRARHVDTLRLELQRGESQARLLRSGEDLAARREDLADLLGCPPDQQFVLETPPLLEVDLAGPRENLRIARAHRMDYAQILEDYADTSRGIALARRALLPDLSLVARYERFDWRSSPLEDPEDELYSVGLAADTDLIAARDRQRIEEEVISREALRQQVLIVENALQRAVNREMRAYRRAQRELEIAGENLTYAGDRARLALRMFEAGRGDSFTVSDSADGFQGAERRLLAARAEASVAAYRLLHTLGTLVDSPDDLRPAEEATR